MNATIAEDYKTLLEARLFAIGPVSIDGHITPAELALIRILREPSGIAILLDLVSNATLPGQLYALLGLFQSGYGKVGDLLKICRERTDQVETQSGCCIFPQPVYDVVARISDGTYISDLKRTISRGDEGE